MDPTSLDQREANRLKDLHQYVIHDIALDASCSELTRLAAQIFGAPFALTGFSDGQRFAVKSVMPLGAADAQELARILDCAQDALDVFVVEDASKDPLFLNAPTIVRGREIRSFAGAPLRVEVAGSSRRNYTVGAFVVLDEAPRKFSTDQMDALRQLAAQCARQVEQSLRLRDLQTRNAAAELALKHSEAFYHSLVEAIPQNIFRKDLRGRFTFPNSNFCRTLNKQPSEIIGKTDFDLFPPELAAKYQQDDRRLLEKGTPFRAIEQHRDAAGNTLYVQVVKSPLFDAHRAVSGIQGIFWDETERYKAEEALAYERELLRAMLDNIPDSIYFKDLDSRFLAI